MKGPVIFFQLGFWHPFGRHSDESAEDILIRKADEIQRNGWTLWSFRYRSMLGEWHRQIKSLAPKKIFVFCSAGKGKDPDGQDTKCFSYQFIGNGNDLRIPIPPEICVRHPFKLGENLASAFVVKRIIHPINSFELQSIEWLSKEGDWLQKRKSGEPRLPTHGEFLIRSRPDSICKMPSAGVRAILELKPQYPLAIIGSDKKEELVGYAATAKKSTRARKELKQRDSDNLKQSISTRVAIAESAAAEIEMMHRSEIVRRLSHEYITRQNEKGAPYFIILNGPRSAIYKNDFKGLVLLNPKKNVIFGACLDNVYAFRKKVMEQRGGEWKRRGGVPGRPNDDSITVHFNENCTRVLSDTVNGPIEINGIQGELKFQNGNSCLWKDVQKFLIRLSKKSI